VTTGLRSFESVKIKSTFVFTNNCLPFPHHRDLFLEQQSVSRPSVVLPAIRHRVVACTALPERPFSKASMKFFQIAARYFQFPNNFVLLRYTISPSYCTAVCSTTKETRKPFN